MPVKIRLMRIGARKRPFYRVVAVDERKKRTGQYLELLGTYNPLTQPKEIKLDQVKIDAWMKKGAVPSTGYLRIIGKAPQRQPRKPKKEKAEAPPAPTPETPAAPEVETPAESVTPNEAENTPVVEQASESTSETPPTEKTPSTDTEQPAPIETPAVAVEEEKPAEPDVTETKPEEEAK